MAERNRLQRDQAWRQRWRRGAMVVLLILILLAGWGWFRSPDAFWLTPDQRGRIAWERGSFEEAATSFQSPFWMAASRYRSGAFKESAEQFGGLAGPAAAYNQGNALVMLGKYQPAIDAYDRALKERPGWADAIQNRAIAVARRDRLEIDPGNMTDGEMGADEIVFDQKGDNQEAGEETVLGGPMSDEEIRQLWMRQVATTPRDFLRSKFAYQAARASAQPEAKETE